METKYTETENKASYDLGEKSELVSCPTAITIKDESGLEKNVDLLGDLGC